MGAYHDPSTGRYTQTETGRIEIDLADLVDDAGAAIGDWTDETNPTFGFDLTNSEAMGIRWNAHATPGAAMFKFRAPSDRKPGTDMTITVTCSKTGATVGDATTWTFALFNNVVGALHDDDADFGGATGAIVGNASAKTVQSVTRTIASADISDGAMVTATIKPTDSTLGTDDIVLLGLGITYEKKVTPV